MKCIAVVPGTKDSARLVEVEKPRADKGSLLVRVLRIGIDGTDIDINQGLYGKAPEGKRELILGHESIGRIEEIGEEVKGFKLGDLVVATVRRPCEEDCLNCHHGESDMCLTGHFKERGINGLDGYLSQYYKEVSDFLVKVPDDLEEMAVLLEPFSIVEKGIFQTFKLQERMLWEPKKVLVLGAGSIGLLTALLCRLKGLTVFLLARKELEGVRAEIVTRAEMTYLRDNIPFEQIRSMYGEMDIILEATGFSPLVFHSLPLLHANGSMCLLGIPVGSHTMTINASQLFTRMVLGNQVLFGSVNANRKYFEMGLEDMRKIENRYPGLLKKLITQRLAMADFRKAFELYPDHIKTTVEMG
jgi:threonine dehydrogenase-like Zn-dependent dehydrogenase